MAEFAMVIVLLMVLFLGLVGVGLWAYAHSLLTNAAGQAARHAANADVLDPMQVSQRAADIMADTVFGAVADSVRCDVPPLAGGTPSIDDPDPGATDPPAAETLPLVEVTCAMDTPLPLPFLADVLPRVEALAHAVRESP